jgi:hypothetical protein
MPDPACVQNSSSAIPVFDCEPVEIDSADDPIEPMGPPPPPEAPPPPAVQMLVERHAVRSVKVLAAEPDLLPVLEASIPVCKSELLSLTAVAYATAKLDYVATFLAALKVGHDLAECSDPAYNAAQQAATERRAEQICSDEGGEPREWIGNALQCIHQQVEP